MKSTTANKKAEAQRILNAARSHIFTHGFRSLLLDKFARKLSMNVRNIYSHHRSKSLLITAVIEAKLAEMDRDLEAIHSEDLHFEESMQAMLGVLHRHSHEYSRQYIRDLTDNATLFEWTRNLRAQILKRHFVEFFELGQREKAIRTDISAARFTDAYFALTDGIFIGNALKTTKGSSVHEIHKELFSILLRGVLLH